jgi:hypothetical protein
MLLLLFRMLFVQLGEIVSDSKSRTELEGSRLIVANG